MAINTIRISLTSFLAYGLMASIISPLGIVSKPIANMFNVAITDATAVFSYLTTGVLIGTIIAIFIFDWLRIKTVILLSGLLVVVAILLMWVINGYAWLPFFLALIGIGCGISLTAAAVVITRVFSDGVRASMLLLTDCFYSIGAVASSYIAAFFVARSFHWGSAYMLAMALGISVLAIAILSTYPEERVEEQPIDRHTVTSQPWPFEIYICIGAVFLYLMGLVSLYSWMPNYAQSIMQMPQEQAGQLVSYLFAGMFAGQVTMFFLVLKFPLGRLIMLSAGGAALINFSLWNINDAEILPYMMLLLGILAGGLLKTLITYGTLMTKHAPTRLVSLLMFSAGLGTAVAPSISSTAVDYMGEISALQLSTGCYFLTFLLVALSVFMQHRSTTVSKNNNQSH